MCLVVFAFFVSDIMVVIVSALDSVSVIVIVDVIPIVIDVVFFESLL